MAITFRGTLVTPLIALPTRTNVEQTVFVLHNSFRSRCNVRVLRAVLQLDANDAPATGSTAICPLFRARRVSISGTFSPFSNTVPGRVALDTAVNAPDPGVRAYYSGGPYALVESQAGFASNNVLWGSYTTKQVSQAEQFNSWDNLLLPKEGVVLERNTALYITVSMNLPLGGDYWLQIMWEEDQIDPGVTIAGVVTEGGSPSESANVLLLTSSSPVMDAPCEVEAYETNTDGAFSFLVSSLTYATVVATKNGGLGTLYTSEAKPFLNGS